MPFMPFVGGLASPGSSSVVQSHYMGRPVLVGKGEVCVLMALMLLHHSFMLFGATLDSPSACRVGLKTQLCLR